MEPHGQPFDPSTPLRIVVSLSNHDSAQGPSSVEGVPSRVEGSPWYLLRRPSLAVARDRSAKLPRSRIPRPTAEGWGVPRLAPPEAGLARDVVSERSESNHGILPAPASVYVVGGPGNEPTATRSTWLRVAVPSGNRGTAKGRGASRRIVSTSRNSRTTSSRGPTPAGPPAPRPAPGGHSSRHRRGRPARWTACRRSPPHRSHAPPD